MGRVEALKVIETGNTVMIRCFGASRSRGKYKTGHIVELVKKLKGGTVLNYARIKWTNPKDASKDESLVALCRILTADHIFGRVS